MIRKQSEERLEDVGNFVLVLFGGIGEVVLLLWSTLKYGFRGKTDFRLVVYQMLKVGVESLPIGLTSALFVGMVFSIQIATEFVQFGASDYIGGVMAIAVARELGPALTGIVISGRVAASIAAELGTMKVTEQIDAISALGSNPIKYLVLPRFIACTLMMPLLIVLADVFCFLGGYLVAVYVAKVNGVAYMESAQNMLALKDIYGGVAKGFVFGALLAVIACYKGMTAKGGAKGVGEATTSSVVTSLIALFIANYFLTLAMFK
ncbi:MAG: ABC transporter permease [Candidatus Margulisbacteria bacterium]|nr:ABC transporter permease [Candidatus Margulisiibacteriota bacterium]